MIAALNTAQSALAAIIPTYLADYERIDADGQLVIPDDDEQFIIDVIINQPSHDWGQTKLHDVTLQVSSWNTNAGAAITRLQAAESALTALKFIPDSIVRLPRDGKHRGYSQDFVKGY